MTRLRPVALLGLIALGCSKGPPQGPPPPPEVAILQVLPRRIDEVFEFVGNVEASKSVDVRPQVGGVIVARPFTEGQAVSAGQVLYRIDPTAYDADWRAAQARLVEAEARQANMEQNLARMSALLRDNAISKQDYDNAVAQAKQAQAGVEAARGVVDRAKKNLNDTAVHAELSGRVGRALLEVGTRVRGPEDVLTTIDVLDPIYVTFRPSGQQLLAWRRVPRTSKLIQPGGGLKVQVALPDRSTAPTRGRIAFVDPGPVRARPPAGSHARQRHRGAATRRATTDGAAERLRGDGRRHRARAGCDRDELDRVGLGDRERTARR